MINRFFAARNFLINSLLAMFSGLISYYALDVWHGSRLSALPDHDYLPDVIELRKQGKIGESLAICHFVQSQKGMPNCDAIVALGKDIESDQASWLGKCARFSEGFFMGKMNSTEAMVGTVVSDFLLIGDLRDLGQQGYNAVSGKDVDKMVVALSSVGAMASAAAFIPEPGEPAVVGVDTGISLLKGLRKINALTNSFARQIMEFATQAIKTRKLGRIGETADHLVAAAKRAPAGTMGTVMKEVESVEDLKAISRWTAIAPNETITALSVNSRQASDWLKSCSDVSGKLLSRTLRKGAAGFSQTRIFLRSGKFLYRGRMSQVRDSLVDWFMDHPHAKNVLLLIGLGGLVVSGLFAVSAVIHLRKVFYFRE